MTDLTTTLHITGMSCGHCVAAVTRRLEALEGVTVRAVEVGRADVVVDAGRVSPQEVAAALDEIGFALDPVPASFGAASQGN